MRKNVAWCQAVLKYTSDSLEVLFICERPEDAVNFVMPTILSVCVFHAVEKLPLRREGQAVRLRLYTVADLFARCYQIKHGSRLYYNIYRDHSYIPVQIS